MQAKWYLSAVCTLKICLKASKISLQHVFSRAKFCTFSASLVSVNAHSSWTCYFHFCSKFKTWRRCRVHRWASLVPSRLLLAERQLIIIVNDGRTTLRLCFGWSFLVECFQHGLGTGKCLKIGAAFAEISFDTMGLIRVVGDPSTRLSSASSFALALALAIVVDLSLPLTAEPAEFG